MKNYLDLVIRELCRRPHVALVGRDPETKMFRLDWRDSHKKHYVRLFNNREQAVTKARDLELHDVIVGYRLFGLFKARPWAPPSSSDLRLSRVF